MSEWIKKEVAEVETKHSDAGQPQKKKLISEKGNPFLKRVVHRKKYSEIHRSQIIIKGEENLRFPK